MTGAQINNVREKILTEGFYRAAVEKIWDAKHHLEEAKLENFTTEVTAAKKLISEAEQLFAQIPRTPDPDVD